MIYSVDQEVVRAKGDYVVGRVGKIIELSDDRVKVAWNGYNKTWVSVDVIQPTSTPYKIIYPDVRNGKSGKIKYPVYMPL